MATSPRLIGSGTYGCVYRPPLCLNNNSSDTRNLVGKIATNEGVETELVVGARIRQLIPDWDRYFGLLDPVSCHPDITPEISTECDLFKNIGPNEYAQVNSYSSPYLGITLNSYREPVSMQWLWDTCSHLIRGLSKLHSHKIYHMDIKATNILIDSMGRARLIDFGIARVNPTVDMLQDVRYSYYPINPLFYNVYCTARKFGIGRLFDPESDLDLFNMYYDTYENWARFYYPNYERDTGSDIIRLSLYAGSLPRYIRNVVLPNIGKVDLYQLADALNDFYIRYRDRQLFTDFRTNPLRYKCRELLNGLLHIDVNQQWNLNKSLNYINSV